MSELQFMRDITTSNKLHKTDQEHYLPTFKRMPIAFERGDGCILYDVDGNEYLDVLAGIAVTSLGHSHPVINKVIARQAEKLLHVSNFFVTKPQVELSQYLTESSQLDHVFFSNSGTESFEGAIKIARKYAYSRGGGGTIVSMTGAFHGRTLAAIAAGKPKMQKGFGPMPEGFETIPFNDIDALKSIMSNEIAAVVLEPIQGEGGVHPADQSYLEEVRKLCHDNDVVLIFDEIQCGIGRTGKFWAYENFDVKPDIITLAKALGNGMPIGAILSSHKVSSAIDFGDHGTTFGGNPIACATSLATVKVINQPGFLKDVREKGQYLKDKLHELKSTTSAIKEIRGMGLMIGVEFDFETPPLAMKMLENGVVANATAQNVLRLVPPLIISKDQIDHLIDVIKDSIQELQNQ